MIRLAPQELPEAIPYLRSYMETPTMDQYSAGVIERRSAYQAKRTRYARRRAIALVVAIVAFVAAAAWLARAMGLVS